MVFVLWLRWIRSQRKPVSIFCTPAAATVETTDQSASGMTAVKPSAFDPQIVTVEAEPFKAPAWIKKRRDRRVANVSVGLAL